MNIQEAVTSVLTKYFVFDGRASRSEFWFFQLAYWIVLLLLTVISSVNTGALYWIAEISYWVIFLGTLVPEIAVSCRRLHDTNRTGWFQCIYMPPLIILVFCGTLMEESYGYDLYYEPSGLLILFLILSLIGSVATLVVWILWMVKDSDPHPNRYGDLPADKSNKNPFRTYVSAESPQVLGGRCVNSNCSAQIQPMFKFCIECGTDQTPKPKFCTSCGASVVGRFCGGCGAPQ